MAATVDDLIWVEYPADATEAEPVQGWMLRLIGKEQKARELPLPLEALGVLAKYVKGGGLDADPDDSGKQRAFLLGKASDAAERAPGLSTGSRSTLSRGSLQPRSTTR